ncbi:hypothetical protein AB0465_31100 [Streptomyces griseoviridis]|uniref:hypothetical protein n=1 Tax=Streptomyces griseoviridis TaxID=45398 RepID=UPI00344B36DF
MWPGQQPPGGEQNPQAQNGNPYQQPGYQQPNPYQQPGYQQPNPYGGQPEWGAPTQPGAPGPSGGGGGGGGNRTKLVAIVAAAAVVVAAGVTGFLVLNKGDEGGKGDRAKGGADDKPSRSASTSATASASDGDDNPRGGAAEKPTVAGWKVVVNPRWGTVFDVPADWEISQSGTSDSLSDRSKADSKPLIVMSAPAYYKPTWCTSDDDKDGRTTDVALAAVGTKGADGAKDTDEVAVNQVPWWVYGAYTQPDKKSITFDKKAKEYTTAAGIEGKYAWARSKDSPQKGTSKCASDGKAITFGFKNSKSEFVAWCLYGATGVDGELPDATIMKIMSTVRLSSQAPTG